MKRAIAVLILALAAPDGLLAAGQPENVQVAGPVRRSIEREAIRMARQSPGTVTPQAPPRSWAVRHPVALGMMIGLGGGIAWGSAQYYEGERPFGPFVALGAGVGVGIGAGVGAIISAVRR
jgi:hypothetical protein